MTRRSICPRVSALVLLAVVSGLLQARTVLADCPTVSVLPTVGSVRGVAFVGRVISREETIDGSHRYGWRVESVIRGDVNQSLAYKSELCFGTSYDHGGRYLVSSSNLTGGSTTDTVAYRIGVNERVELVDWWSRGSEAFKRFGAKTLSEAISIVAPNALPNTSTTAMSSVGLAAQAMALIPVASSWMWVIGEP